MKNSDNRKKPLTPELLAECKKLKTIFDSKKKDLKISQGTIADEMDVNQSSISHYLNGVNALNAQAASTFAKVLRVSVSDFSPRLAKEINDIAINAFDEAVELSSLSIKSTNHKDGKRLEYINQLVITFDYPVLSPEEILKYLNKRLLPKTIRRRAVFTKNINNGIAYEITNDSMSSMDLNSFPPGCKVLIDLDQNAPENEKFYLVLLPNGKEVFKQYINDGGISYLKSLNTDFKTIQIDESSCVFIGKAVDRNLGDIE